MFAFQINTCNRGFISKDDEAKQAPAVEKKQQRKRRLQRESMLSALSSGKYNKKKVEKTRHDQ